MNSGARWAIGILVALVIGLAVGLAVVVGDDSDPEPETVTLETEPETTTEATEAETTPTETQPPTGGETAPGGSEEDGSGGLGFD
ncbi:MAG: hypothetical protein ACRDKH_09260 [Solirubrobacterales bacterium]